MRKRQGRSINIGKSNLEMVTRAVKPILRVLSDESWHRYSDLEENTKISSATLTKYLGKLQKLQLIQKKREVQSMEYPKPVYYKAEPELVTWTQAFFATEELSKLIEPALLETKNPNSILEAIESDLKIELRLILQKIIEEKNVPEHKLRFLLELFVWEPYRVLTWKLIEATKKHIHELS